MAHFQLTFLFITIFVASNAFYLPPNTKTEGGEDTLWFLENKLSGPKFDFIKQKIEAKQEAKQNSETAEPNNAEVLDQKLAFLENKFKYPFVGETAVAQEVLDKKFALLANFLKQIHATKLNEQHQVAKRSIKNTEDGTETKDPAFGAAIGNYFLNQKLAFLENKLKGSLVDFDAIKEKIKAKKEAKLSEETGNAAEEEDSISKRSVKLNKEDDSDKIGGPEYSAAIRDHFLKQKFNFLENKFKQMNMDSEALMQKIQSKQQGAQ